MLSRLLLLACASVAVAAEPATEPRGSTPKTATEVPWTPSFTTTVRGSERSFVELHGRTYFLIRPEEIAAGLADDQDVAMTAKLRRLPGDRFGLYRAEGTALAGAGDALAGKLDGDNLHLTGTLSTVNGQRLLTVHDAMTAPSDIQLLTVRQTGIAEDDWDRRLGVVSWCRDQARISGSDAWSATADVQLARVIEDMGVKSAEHRDVALVTRAIDLALGQLKDPVVASRVASPAWIRQHGGPQAEAISRRMRGLGFAVYQEKWLPRPQALELEFNDRFAALPWKDADGYYKLGRWADENAESLPRGRELSWRCYQAGNRADPSHVGLARELGIKPTAGSGPSTGSGDASSSLATAFIDLESGLYVPAPVGWRRGQLQSAGVAWIDPESETATILARMIQPPVDENATWNLLADEARARPGFIEVASAEVDVGTLRIRYLRSTWTEGDQQRYAALAMAFTAADKPIAILEARGLPGERERLDAALDAAASGTTIKTAAPGVPTTP